MLTLAMDTADRRGSLALLRDEALVACVAHETEEDYSTWLLPATDRLAATAGIRLSEVGLYAVCGGPGSFTGLRVGLTAVKAWSEVHNKPIAAVSRLEAIATVVAAEQSLIAAWVDAHRKQVFGGLYRREAAGLRLVGEEMVIGAGGFLAWVRERSQGEGVSWSSLDPGAITQEAEWAGFAAEGARVTEVSAVLAPVIGQIGVRMARENRLTDALRLDANYVRRSDAELFWKGPSGLAKIAHGTQGK